MASAVCRAFFKIPSAPLLFLPFLTGTRIRGARQSETKLSVLAVFALHPNVLAVRLDDGIAHGKADAHVLLHVEIVVRYAGKPTVENRRKLFLRNADSVVADGKT